MRLQVPSRTRCSRGDRSWELPSDLGRLSGVRGDSTVSASHEGGLAFEPVVLDSGKIDLEFCRVKSPHDSVDIRSVLLGGRISGAWATDVREKGREY